MIPTKITVNGCEFFLDMREMGNGDVDNLFYGWWSFRYFGPLPSDEESVGNPNDGYIPYVSNGRNRYYLVYCAESKYAAYLGMENKVMEAVDASYPLETEMYDYFEENGV